MEAINYKLEVFEGPMDLLLALISKHKLNINDIPILTLIEQYIDYVRQMEKAEMEVAGEFLEMAARLVYIKTVSLLPVYEEAEKLKQELTGELIEYRDMKLMANKLSLITDGFNHFCKAPDTIEQDLTYTRTHEPLELYNAYLTAAGRGKRKLPPPIDTFKAIVVKKIVSVSSKISTIIDRLKSGKKQKLISFYYEAKSTSDLVATFLALLELIKSKKIQVDGEHEEMTASLVKEEI